MLTDYISELEKKKDKKMYYLTHKICFQHQLRNENNISPFIYWLKHMICNISVKKNKKKQVDLCYMFCAVVYPNVLSDDQTPKMCNRGSGAFQSVACRYNSQERVREWRWTKPNTNQTLKHDLVGSCAASQHPKTTRYFCFHCFVWE